LGGNATQGFQFSFAGPQSYSLDTIGVAAYWAFGSDPLTISLRTDVGGQPGAVLESFSFPYPNTPVLVGTSASHLLLTPGTNYWLIGAASDNVRVVWNFSSTLSGTGPAAWSMDAGSTWYTGTYNRGAFRINGTPSVVPLPGAALLGLIGLASAGRRLRRERTL